MRGFPRFTLPVGGLVAVALLVAACSAAMAFTSPDLGRAAAPPRAADPMDSWPGATVQPTPLLKTPGPGVADLLARPPAPGRWVEVDAYFSGAGLVPHHAGPRPPGDQVLCPANWEAALTDRPFLGLLSILNGVHSNVLPEDAPWLIAVTPDAVWPGVRTVPPLPYHARLRGYLGDPAFSHCPHGERVFVVQEVVRVYAAAPPVPPAHDPSAEHASWPRHHEASAGYSLAHPPGWRVERLDGATLVLRAPEWPGYPVLVRLHAGETHYDQYDPASAPALLQGNSWGAFEQGWAFDGAFDGQRLAGFQVDRCSLPRQRTVSVLFSGSGHTYELALRYPLGFDAAQPLLTAYSAIVESFRLDTLPAPSPTPTIRQTLGAGRWAATDGAGIMPGGAGPRAVATGRRRLFPFLRS